MPRKKRERNRGRIIRQEMQDKFLNQWTNNQENSYDLKTVSIIFRNENDCLFQILLSEDHIFNGIFLITTYKFSKEEDGTYMLTIEDLEDKGWTGFHRDENGSFFIYNYVVKGAIKSSIETLQENGVITKIPAYKKWIDRMIDVKPRRIFFIPDKKEAEVLERPLRTMTPKGERVTVVRSDIVDIGTEIEYEVILLKNGKSLTMDVIEQALANMALGQWRGSGGYGRVDSYAI